MILQHHIFKKFLLSKNSNVISYAISKIHSSYLRKHEKKKISVSLILEKFLFFFDKKDFILNKKLKSEVLIISNIVSVNNMNINKDIYYGNLEKLLNKKKIKTTKVFRNFTYKKSVDLWKKINKNTVILSKRSSYFTELKIFYLFLKEIYKFKFSDKYSQIKKFIILKDFISIIPNLRLIYQLKRLIKIINPRVVIFTYEGNAWERLLIFLCKKDFKNITTIGYQFSTMKNHQLGFYRKLKKNYNPDYIATSGKITYKQISDKINFSKIFKLGSGNFLKDNNNMLKKKNHLLVALDNNETELFRMLEFCINFATQNKKKNIILRIHPILDNYFEIYNRIISLTKNINNLNLSNKSLHVDLKKSKYLLFTDTVIGVSCLYYKVIPLFFMNKLNKNIFNNNFPKKYIIKNYVDLKKILSKKTKNKLPTYFNYYKNNYFERYDLTELIKIIASNKI